MLAIALVLYEKPSIPGNSKALSAIDNTCHPEEFTWTKNLY